MKLYDLCVKVENLKETIDIAKKLGWDGLGLIIPYSVNYMKELGALKESVKKLKSKIDVGFGIELDTKDSRDVRKTVKAIRRDVELVVVRGGTPEVNRIALETPEVDILTHNDGDMKINHVLAKLAAKNSVAIGFVFSNILLSYKRTRISLFSDMISNAKVLKKYRSPFIISSGSLSVWDMRSPSDLLAFGKLLGFQENQVNQSMSDAILRENRKRLGKKWVMPGVEIE
jgi:ribonuclease P/MRP protein subunit RPP1